ncbi:glycosyltransferase [Paenibacillus sp. N3/727]|uniref:glycosyltransferase n=1 Tax=Paenibacillus sp. N3/727 TaxID=2925845 RepID=UPI001F53CF40|nr:glycosyltransferase [Paenibacillus sp. N3/727]UNK19757.1 glycosyltransferase [Paenibacillus sp. N3/727]
MVGKILIIGPERSTSYQIILLQPLRYLEELGYFTFDIQSHKQATKSTISSYDIIIFLRSIEPDTLRCLEWAHLLGKKIIYVIDDHFLAIPTTTRIGQLYSQPSYQKTCTTFLETAHVVKVESPIMYELIRQQFNPHVIYFPGCVDFSFFKPWNKRKKHEGQLVIGYEGAKKESSFQPVIAAMKQIMMEYGDIIRLEFYGYCPAELKDHPNVTHMEHNEDYGQFMKQLFQANWDIGLAPMEDKLYYHCKSNVKFRDYASCHIPGIYSLSPVYRECVFHKQTGYFVPQTKQGWYLGIQEMINNPQMRKSISKRALKVVKKHHTLKLCAANWKKLLHDL